MRGIEFVKRDIFSLILVLVTLTVCYQNYVPNTYLMGWDSLHPELNFAEAFRRVWEGVWRGEQGLGVLAAHSHMADWPRIVFVWLASFVLPVSFLRYFFIFTCLILGPLGVYKFCNYVYQNHGKSYWSGVASFLAGLFYLLNLGTVQNFYVPFEMFVTAYAILPWLFWSGLRFLQEGSKNNLLVFALVVILGSPMAYAATLWYTTFAGLFLFFVFWWLLSPAKRRNFKRLIAIIFVSILLNLYWILPNLYFVKNQSNTVSNSTINTLFSPEAFLKNQQFGNTQDILIQKNFLFGWRNFDFQNNEFKDLLNVWINHLNAPWVLQIGYLLGGISALGLVLVFAKKEKIGLSLFSTLLFTLFFLLNANGPTKGIYIYLYSHFDLFREGLRMPFTKFSVLFEFLTAFYFGYFLFVVLTLRSKLLLPLKFLLTGGVVLGLFYFISPAFSGDLIGKNLKIKLPNEYLEAYGFLNSQKGRIMKLPIHTLYNWEYHDWELEGSGWFTWFLSNNVLLDRDFDRWSSYNEDFYRQASFALYSKDLEGLERTLQKFNVKYLLLDESIVNPGGSSDILFVPETKSIIKGLGIKEVKKFDFLKIYQTNLELDNDVVVRRSHVPVSSVAEYSDIDSIYKQLGDYIYSESGTSYPFVSFDKRGDTEIGLRTEGLVFSNKVTGQAVVFPTNEVIKEDLSINRGFESAYNCDLNKQGTAEKIRINGGVEYKADMNGVSCDYLSYPDLKHNQAYVLRVKGENKQGRGLKIYLYNHLTKRMDLEELLPNGNFDEYYFIYPKSSQDKGYTLNLETRSYGKVSSHNVLSAVEFYPVDYTFLSTFKGETLEGAYSIYNGLKVLDVKKYGNWLYTVAVEGAGIIELNQGYESGWKAFQAVNFKFQISNFKLELQFPNLKNKLEHTKVNSWANGWIVDNSQCAINNAQLQIVNCKLLIVFWPQLLQYFGLLVSILTLFVIVRRNKNLHKS